MSRRAVLWTMGLLWALAAGCGGGAGSDAPAPGPAPAANLTQQENALSVGPGRPSDWVLHQLDVAGHVIEGYASAVSVDRGGSIDVFVNTTDPSYELSVYRVGWYGGNGGRLMLGPVNLPGEAQPLPHSDPVTGLVECDWQHPYTLAIPAAPDDAWVSGIYLVKLTASSGVQRYVPFVVRDDARPSKFLFQSSVTTSAAYNAWGGRSLYPGALPAATRVSLNRPFSQYGGAGLFLEFEIAMVRFLEREGYDVSYTTDVDVDADPAQLSRHRAFLSVGHDEYWTLAERDGLEAARDAGIHLGFFGSNTGYWQIRLEPSAIGGAPRRTVVGYKERCQEDPLYASQPGLATCRWRDAPVNRPEAALVGVMYAYSPVTTDIVIADCPAWLCAGTALVTGSVLPGRLGYEADAVTPSSPPNLTVVAASPYTDPQGRSHVFNTTFYTAPSGAGVFASGSMDWSLGLDDYHHGTVDPNVQQMTRNVLARFAP